MARISEPKAKEPVWYLKTKGAISGPVSQRNSLRPFSSQPDSPLPERSAKSREEGKGRHVIWLTQSPVIGGKGSGQGHLAQRQHEVGQPEEHECIEDLQAQQGTVVGRLATIEGKLAVATGTLAAFIR